MSKVYIVSDKNSNRISESLNDQYVRKGPALFMTPYKRKAILLAGFYKHNACITNSEEIVIDEYESLDDMFAISKSWTLKELEDEDSK
jgi:hypothetical protein